MRFDERRRVEYAQLESIRRFFSDELGIDIEIFMNQRRADDIVAIRHLFIYLAFHIGIQSVSVAEYIDRDHSTVLYARRKVRTLCKIYAEDDAKIQEMIRKFDDYRRERNYVNN